MALENAGESYPVIINGNPKGQLAQNMDVLAG